MPASFKLEPRRYLVSLLLVLIATLVTLVLRPFFDGKSPLIAFLLAVIFSAAYGGMLTGLMATAACLAMILGFLKDEVVIVFAQSGVTLFTILAVCVSFIMGKLRQSNAVLAEAKERLEKQSRALALSNEELRRFAYTLAHDIRNPLKSVGALTQLLVDRNDKKLDESSKECARLIVQGVRRMEDLTSGLLEYAVSVGDEAQDGSVDSNAVVATVLQDLATQIESTGAVIEACTLPELQVNQSHLFQLFSNLISNAVKYRGVRRPEIAITAREEGGFWRICVRDNGLGFEMKFAEDIFGMLKRLHGSDYEGNGIGLALCKAIVTRYGGRIWAESEPGNGSAFYFTLPKAKRGSQPSRITAGRAMAESQTLEKTA